MAKICQEVLIFRPFTEIFSDLFEFIEKNGAAEESVAHRIFTQLVSAVRYLARNQIIHRDIKDENIIIDPNLNIELIG